MQLLVLFIVIAVPASAYAVSATLSVFDAEGVLRGQGRVPAEGDGGPRIDLSTVNAESVIGDCVEGLGLCFFIAPDSSAAFLFDGTLGQLVLQNVFVLNIGSETGTLVIDYQHTTPATPGRTYCTAMSMDGWFSTPDFGPAGGDSVALDMHIQFDDNEVLQRVEGTNPGTCTAVRSGLAGDMVYTVATTATNPALNFYNPANPRQVIQQMTFDCVGCPATSNATLIKKSSTTLKPGDANNFLGSAAGYFCESGATCTSRLTAALESRQTRWDFKGVVDKNERRDDKIKVFGILFGTTEFNVKDIKRDRKDVPFCTLRVEGSTGATAPVINSDFGRFDKEDKITDLKIVFLEKDLGLGQGVHLQPGQTTILECQALIAGTPVTITAADVVQATDLSD